MDDHQPLGTALHDRVRDEHPDVERLLAGATRAGTRIRRRRRAGAAGGTAAAVAVVALVGAQLGGGPAPSTGTGFVGSPSVVPTSTPTPSAPISTPSADPAITLSELQQVLDDIADARRAGTADRPRIRELARLLDAVRLAERQTGPSGLTRQQRQEAMQDLLEALRRR